MRRPGWRQADRAADIPTRHRCSAPSTATDVSTSLRVCFASACSTSLFNRRASRCSYDTTNRFTTSVTVITAMPSGKTRGVPPLTSLSYAADSTCTSTTIRKTRMPERGHRLVLAMTVRMVLVRRPSRDGDADERDDVRRRVGQRMKAVREDRDGPGRVSEDDLDERDREVEDEDAVEDADDLRVTVSQVKCKMQNSKRKQCLHSASCTFEFRGVSDGVRRCARSGSATSAAAPSR